MLIKTLQLLKSGWAIYISREKVLYRLRLQHWIYCLDYGSMPTRKARDLGLKSWSHEILIYYFIH